eukprot:25684-Eustigmatos_ZCMA.PRE.1
MHVLYDDHDDGDSCDDGGVVNVLVSFVWGLFCCCSRQVPQGQFARSTTSQRGSTMPRWLVLYAAVCANCFRWRRRMRSWYVCLVA